MNIVFLLFFSFLNLFRIYSDNEIKLSFSPKDFYVGTKEKVFYLNNFGTLFSPNAFNRYLGKEFYEKIEQAAIMRTYHSPSERNSTKVSELNKKKILLEVTFPSLLLYAENNQSFLYPFFQKQGFLNKIDGAVSSLPMVKKITDISENFVESYNSSVGANFKIMAQEFTMHNLLFKVTLGGSIISSMVLIAKDIISDERLRKSTSKVMLFFIVANFVIFHWRKFYYGGEYVRHHLRKKGYTKNIVDLLENNKENIFSAIQYLELLSVVIFLYIKKDTIRSTISQFKNNNFYSLIKENLLLLNENKFKSVMFFGIFPIVFFQKNILDFIVLLSKKIEEYLISGFTISKNKEEIYNNEASFFNYIETILYQENPQIAESDFESLAVKIKQNIQKQKNVLSKSEETDFTNQKQLQNIRDMFTFSVINDVTGEDVKVYDFKKNIDDFILVQKLLLLCKICLNESLFNTIRLKDKDGQDIQEKDLLTKIDSLCENLVKEKTRKFISQTIVSLFNIIKENKKTINQYQENFSYIEELVDKNFIEKYPRCFEHLENKNNFQNHLLIFKMLESSQNFFRNLFILVDDYVLPLE